MNQKMTAVVLHEHGGLNKLQLQEVPVPAIAASEVLVEVHAAALNHLDLWIRKGWPGLRLDFPHIPGSDAAGTVVQVGAEVNHIVEGDDVLLAPGWASCGCPQCLAGDDNLCRNYKILGRDVWGTYATYVKIPADNVFAKPAGLNFEEAASVPLVYLTAWNMLVHQAVIRPGEDVLILAAGSGVGSAGIQIAKLFGARVIATASSEAKLRKAVELGADDVINYQEEALHDLVMQQTGSKGVDVVFEHVGKTTWNGSIRVLKRGGRLVTCGASSGYEAVTDLRYVFFRNIRILGNFMGRKAGLKEALQFFPDRLKPVVDTVYPLHKAAEAQNRLMNREQFGKVILEP
jgi:NADPH:quinone reductase-like Zn-dependent oxidoreductase